LLGLPGAARAYRPFNSTDAAVAGEGELEIELGPVGFLKEGAERFLVAPSLILNWGLAPRWELVLEGRQFIRLGGAPGRRWALDDSALSLKTVLRDGVLPATDGDGRAGGELAVIASQRWDAVTIHLNGAASWTRAHTAGLFAGLIVEGHDAWTVRPVGEIFVEAEQDAPTTISGLAGAIWRVQENFAVDAAVRVAQAGTVTVTEIRAGLTWAFGVGFRDLRRRR